jgi:IS30 family transposase
MENKEQPILTLIQRLKDGQISPELIDKDQRQLCIEVFIGEGYTISSIAQILNKCEKTIRRDLEEIRERNALTPDVGLAKKIIGDMVVSSHMHRGHLMRLARSKDASVSEKAQAEYYAHRVDMEIIDRLQTLGYLPLKPKTVVGDFTYNVTSSDEATFEDLRGQLKEIEKIAIEAGGYTPELECEVKKIQSRIERADIEKKIKEVSNKQKEGQNEPKG